MKVQADTADDLAGSDVVARSINAVSSLGSIDKRTRAWRRYQSIRSAVLADAGGEANTSEIQRQLISKFCTLAIQLEAMEAAALVDGGDIDVDKFGRAAGHLRRIGEVLGLTRVARLVPSLQEYLQHKAEDEAA
jgi:hypothetical protein